MSTPLPLLICPDATTTQGLALPGRKLHFSGIGGSGMSGLARMAKKRGAVVTGSDKGGGPAVEALRAEGFAVSTEQDEKSLPWGTEVLVISAAIKNDHPEVVEARRRNLEVVKYAQMLGALMRGRTGIAVAGTHGKSTTTSILAHILISAGLDPSFIVGANCPQIGGGARTSAKTEGEVLVAEACEFDRSFHNFHPTHAVILNVEADHLDIYSGIEEIVESFAFFARKLPQDATGSLLIHHESPHRFKITAGLDCKVETLGFSPQADWQVSVDRDGGVAQVQLRCQGEKVCAWASPMPGDHFAYNAACAAVLANRAGAPWDAIAKAIASFAGLDRRMQRLGKMKIDRTAIGGGAGEATVIDDYGHHPTEIDTTLRALRQFYKPKRLVCVFQPHQHSRTRFFMEEFATAFSDADVVMVPEIFFSRDSEQERRAVTAGDLVARLRKRHVTAWNVSPLGAIVEQLRETARDGDLIVTMGAGDVWTVSHELVK